MSIKLLNSICVKRRGEERKEIFISDKDREDFIARLSAMAEEGAMDIYAWALLENHFHILVKTKDRPLSSSMRKILTGYAVNFNKRLAMIVAAVVLWKFLPKKQPPAD